MNENDKKRNPLDKAKVIPPNSNLDRKFRHKQKLDEFRDQLNDQLFDGNEHDGKTEELFEKRSDIKEVKKENIIPPITHKLPIEVKQESDDNHNSKLIASDIFNVKENDELDDIFEIKEKFPLSVINDNLTNLSKNKSGIMNNENNLLKSEKEFTNENKMETSNMNKLENAKFNKIVKEKKVTATGTKNNKPVPIINSPINSRIKTSNFLSDSYSNKSLKLASDNNIKENSKELNQVCETNNSNENNSKLNISLTSLQFSKNFEKLKSEIWDLKQSKNLLEAEFKIEKNKTSFYEKEITEIRQELNNYRLKEISKGESMVRLEIQNLTNELNYRKKENQLLQKENESLCKEVQRLQQYIADLMQNGVVASLAEDKGKIHEEEIEFSIWNKNLTEKTMDKEDNSKTKVTDKNEENIIQYSDSSKLPILNSNINKNSHFNEEADNIFNHHPDSITTTNTNKEKVPKTTHVEEIPNNHHKSSPKYKTDKKVIDTVSNDAIDIFTKDTEVLSALPQNIISINKNTPLTSLSKNKQIHESKSQTSSTMVKENQKVKKQNKPSNIFAFGEEDAGNIFGTNSPEKDKTQIVNLGKSIFD